MTVSSTALIGLIALFALWFVAAGWAVLTGLSMRSQARTLQRRSKRLTRLLDESPTQPLLVRSDGRLEGSERLGRWFGLDALPAYFSELLDEGAQGQGIKDDDHKALDEAIRATQRSGSGFSLEVRVARSSRRLLIKGQLSDPATMPGNAALLWIYDATASQEQIEQLGHDADEARRAFQALSGLIEAAPMPMWYRTSDLKLTLVNSAYVRAVGHSEADAVIAQAIELVEPLDGRSAQAFAADAAESGEIQRRTVSATVDGGRRTLEIVDVPIGNNGIAGYAIDVQDLQSARNALHRFREAQRDMLDSLSAGVVQFNADRSLIFSNQSFQRLFAIRQQWIADDIEFDRLLDRMREGGKLPETRDFPAWRLERRQWFHNADASEENWLLGDGTHLRVIAQPMPDGGLVLFFEDRSKEVELASARDTLLRVRTAMFDNLFEALAVFAPDGKLHLWNRRFGESWQVEEEILAAHPRVDELLKVLAKRLKRPARISEVRDVIRSASVERKQKAGRLRLTNDRHFEYAAIPLPDGNVLFTMLDISDSQNIESALRERNEALVSAERIKSEFLANMSYEFRTPLTSIGGFAEMLAQGLAGPLTSDAEEYVDAILKSVERLSKQINTVLDLSQSEAGTLPLSLQSVPIKTFLADMLAEREARIEHHGHHVAVTIAHDAGDVAIDRQRMAQAIGHVLDNSIEHIGDRGRIVIDARRQAQALRLILSDDGPGMVASLVASINDGIAASTDAKEGDSKGRTALGLALAREIVLAHGGQFELASQLDVGTMVTIVLPQ
ncbi:PAS domain-containing sensor histidine kinase [Alterisphingorhabdus coralli]|uniref:histidine kinase n=1 Tax=Alterisphingorhabdus coralli TaxID=3071408 RepID=A0AA97F7U9_9SPHN|nr:PAS-domain containing protein [Parasphingorhabdus sp. SCSIO 66989]WOE74125.1 PAS-domain containing protein [Parasphingorhabdus sp. SCSIO 66989]